MNQLSNRDRRFLTSTNSIGHEEDTEELLEECAKFGEEEEKGGSVFAIYTVILPSI